MATSTPSVLKRPTGSKEHSSEPDIGAARMNRGSRLPRCASPSARRRSRRRTAGGGAGPGRRHREPRSALWPPNLAGFGHPECIARRNSATGLQAYRCVVVGVPVKWRLADVPGCWCPPLRRASHTPARRSRRRAAGGGRRDGRPGSGDAHGLFALRRCGQAAQDALIFRRRGLRPWELCGTDNLRYTRRLSATPRRSPSFPAEPVTQSAIKPAAWPALAPPFPVVVR
jgi:hypothetical protein